jgi:hypothetical protein
MAEIEKITQVVKFLKRGQQREAMDYMHDELDGADLTEISQMGTRLTALADSVSNIKSREREAKRRSVGGRAPGEYTAV